MQLRPKGKLSRDIFCGEEGEEISDENVLTVEKITRERSNDWLK